MKIQFPRFTFVEDAKASIRAIVSVGNDIVSLLQDRLERTPIREVVPMNVSVADRPFIVQHNLNATPTFVSGSGSVNAHIYWTPADKSEWSKSIVKVRYPSTGLVTVRIEA